MRQKAKEIFIMSVSKKAQLVKDGKKSSGSCVSKLLLILLILIAVLACVGLVLNIITNSYYSKLTSKDVQLIDGKFDAVKAEINVKDEIKNMDIYQMSEDEEVVIVTTANGETSREKISFSVVQNKVKENYDNASKAENLKSDKDVYNYVFIGNDSYDTREQDETSADVVMIMSYNQKTNKVTYYTLNAKSFVFIPDIMDGGKVATLADAYSWGGELLLCKTIQENYSIAINGFIDMGLDSCAKSIDQFGGIELKDVDVDKLNASIEFFNTSFGTNMQAVTASSDGTVRLSGEQATAYLRGVGGSRFDATKDVLKATVVEALGNGASSVMSLVDDMADKIDMGVSRDDFAALCNAIIFSTPTDKFADANTVAAYSDIIIKGQTINWLDNEAVRANIANMLY
jgi:anionic cell wall polymer biosynthesis LytR-Cps2A-Psr (LCP) family protein